MAHGYLTEISDREYEACRRLLLVPFLSERLFGSLGLQASFSWFVLRLEKERVVPSSRGDIDILAGPLTWADPGTFLAFLSEERANAQPDRHDSWNYQACGSHAGACGRNCLGHPPINKLVGVEAKCAYLDPRADRIGSEALRSTKSSPAER